MFHPFLDLEGLTDNQLYEKLATVHDRIKSVNIYQMNGCIIEQLDMQRKSIEWELQERVLKQQNHKKPEIDDHGNEIIKSDTGTVWCMDTAANTANKRSKR